MKKISIFSLIIIFIVCSDFYILAHPHVRLSAKLIFEYNRNIINGFWVEWNFDEYFSASIISEFDKNRDGIFDKKEQSEVYSKAFINLKQYGFFVFIRKGNLRRNPDKVEKFSVRQKNGLLYYRFYVPMKEAGYGDDFSVSIFDRTFYCNIKYDDDPVEIIQANGKKPVFEVQKNKKYPVYYNPLGAADDMKIYTKWKSGLQTAFPLEVHLFFK